MEDLRDFYIKWDRLKGYDSTRVENTNIIDTIVSKIEMILLTNTGDCIDPEFGADISTYIWKTKFPASTIEDKIQSQIQKYVPELSNQDFSVKCYILPGSVQDIGIVQVSLGIKKVSVLFS